MSKNQTQRITRGKVASNFIWRFLERIGFQSVGFIVQIVLARLLDPEDFGIVALVGVFTMILNVFIDSGLGNALIQKKEPDDADYSSVFYFNMLMCISLYIVVFFASPAIASFYRNESLTPVVRVLSLTLVISGIKNVQQAYVAKNLMFRKFFFSTLIGTVGAAVIGISLAYFGFGVWALVAQQVCNASIDTLVLWITVKWRPKRVFSPAKLKSLFSYGWKMLVDTLLYTGCSELRNLIIGRRYSSSDLAFYSEGWLIPKAINSNITASISSVVLPAMSSEQDNIERVKSMTRWSIKVSMYIIAPLAMGLLFVGDTFVSVLLSDKWLPCVPYLRIFCLIFLLPSIDYANINAMQALGRSDLVLKTGIVQRIIEFILLLITFRISVMAMAYSLVISGIISTMVHAWPNRKLLGYRYVEQVKDCIPYVIMAVIMGVAIYPLRMLGLPRIAILVLQVMLGGGVYLVMSLVTKCDAFYYLLGIVRGKSGA